ncbi:MAG: formate dehydrogenase accessory protein FdhE [Candidatus Desantisbacteria bacterium]
MMTTCESGHISKQQIDFCEELISIQSAHKERLGEEEVFPKPDKEQALERIKDGLPLISFESIKVKEEIIKNILDDVCNALTKHGLCKEEDIEQLKTAGFDRLKSRMLVPDNEIDVLIAFIFTMADRIILESIADKLRDSIDDSMWLRNYCPMCGNKPQMARLQKEDGKRLLQCAICSTQWQFMRIKCIYCGTEDQNDLRFFWADDSSPYRVDVCDKCKGYIKTVDERKCQEGMKINHFIEDIATAYLDILAVEQGYHDGVSDKTGGGSIQTMQ